MAVRRLSATQLSSLGLLQGGYGEGAVQGINLILRLEGKLNDLPP